MTDRIYEIVRQIKKLEEDLLLEIQKKEEEFFYEIRARRVYFEKQIRKQHRRLKTHLARYVFGASLANLLTVPVIWVVLPPAILLDVFVSLFQAVCFPVYGIPKVRRCDYIIFDHNYLRYLNIIEKFNCIYCSYFNGLVAWVQEVAARTEQYWCPVKHARKLKTMHSRYKNFLDYGDAKAYKKRFQEVRRNFSDIK